ncbi:hypothetical protein CR513_32195, partial [Mucuna pruriens]
MKRLRMTPEHSRFCRRAHIRQTKLSYREAPLPMSQSQRDELTSLRPTTDDVERREGKCYIRRRKQKRRPRFLKKEQYSFLRPEQIIIIIVVSAQFQKRFGTIFESQSSNRFLEETKQFFAKNEKT